MSYRTDLTLVNGLEVCVRPLKISDSFRNCDEEPRMRHPRIHRVVPRGHRRDNSQPGF